LPPRGGIRSIMFADGGVRSSRTSSASMRSQAATAAAAAGGMPQYAVLPQATHVDRRRRVSGAAVVEEEGFRRLPGQEQQSAVPQRWCGSDTSGSTPGQLRDSAMKAGGDWTGTRPSCNLRADRRCLLCVLRASVGGCSLVQFRCHWWCSCEA